MEYRLCRLDKLPSNGADTDVVVSGDALKGPTLALRRWRLMRCSCESELEIVRAISDMALELRWMRLAGEKEEARELRNG